MIVYYEKKPKVILIQLTRAGVSYINRDINMVGYLSVESHRPVYVHANSFKKSFTKTSKWSRWGGAVINLVLYDTVICHVLSLTYFSKKTYMWRENLNTKKIKYESNGYKYKSIDQRLVYSIGDTPNYDSLPFIHLAWGEKAWTPPLLQLIHNK